MISNIRTLISSIKRSIRKRFILGSLVNNRPVILLSTLMFTLKYLQQQYENSGDKEYEDRIIELKEKISYVKSNCPELCNVRPNFSTKEKYRPIKINIEVEKQWVGNQLPFVTILLYADGEIFDSVNISDREGWSHVFESLDKNTEDGYEIEYSIGEVELEKYVTEITGNPKEGYSIKNTEFFASYILEDCETNEELIVSATVDISDPIKIDCTECPEGYRINSFGQCEIYLEEEATYTGESILVEEGDRNANYNKFGARVYSPVDMSLLPIVANTDIDFIQSNLVPLAVTDSLTGFWQSTSSLNGRLNTVGIWGDVPDNEWLGFTVCIDIPETSTYCVGFSADNYTRIKLNGESIITMEENSARTFNYWHILQIELDAGLNILTMEGKNGGSDASIGLEIYEGPASDIVAITDEAVLEQKVVWSTLSMIGQDFQTGETIGYQCEEGWSLKMCEEEYPMCVKTDIYTCYCDCVEFEEIPDKCFRVKDTTNQKGIVVSEATCCQK